MSAQFVLKFRAAFVRVVESSAGEVCELVERKAATPFVSEPEAWHAAHRLQLRPEFCEVEPFGRAARAASSVASQREATHHNQQEAVEAETMEVVIGGRMVTRRFLVKRRKPLKKGFNL